MRRLAVTVAGVLAALLLIATEFAPVATVDVASGACEVINDTRPELADRCNLVGFERHGGALVVLGLLAVAMAYGAGIGASRPAALALVAIGAIVLALGLIRDLPETSRTGLVGRSYEATGHKGLGFWLELGGAGLAIGTGLAALGGPRELDDHQR